VFGTELARAHYWRATALDLYPSLRDGAPFGWLPLVCGGGAAAWGAVEALSAKRSSRIAASSRVAAISRCGSRWR